MLITRLRSWSFRWVIRNTSLAYTAGGHRAGLLINKKNPHTSQAPKPPRLTLFQPPFITNVTVHHRAPARFFRPVSATIAPPPQST